MFLENNSKNRLTQSETQKTKLQLLSPKVQKHLIKLSTENNTLSEALNSSENYKEFADFLKNKAEAHLKQNPIALQYFNEEVAGRDAYKQLRWSDFAAIRILDYLKFSSFTFEDPNKNNAAFINEPFNLLWLALKEGKGPVNEDFIAEMVNLFAQFEGTLKQPENNAEQLSEWMEQHPSGIDPRVVEIRNKNKERIIKVLVKEIDRGNIVTASYTFSPGITAEDKYKLVHKWWNEKNFHFRFAVREPELLNRLLDNSLDKETMQVLMDAQEAGIPFFVNPYYLSLLDVKATDFALGADLAIRDYVIYSRELIDEFGSIVAWEKEDQVEPGKPNAAGWILPTEHNLHRRYPQVAILIPDTVGRACGGLCVSCQRMYDFQSGHLNFDLDKLSPKKSWDEKLQLLMNYYENDTQLRDILITGGDALMSSDKSLKKILDNVYEMVLRKKEANKNRADGEKYAEILRVRLGTRLPVYLPQRITPELGAILKDFKKKASAAGIKQFVVQTHFESAMEVTPEVVKGVKILLDAGWMITNQLVFTAAASRRGHTAKLRKVLNNAGIITYYTFTVKGYMENKHNFATNARAVQEQLEEKTYGTLNDAQLAELKDAVISTNNMSDTLSEFLNKHELPFIATDRNVLNLPGVGKSLTFRNIGLTADGRRILSFDHDNTRWHSPVIHDMGRVTIIESKTIKEYLTQLEDMGEDAADYSSIYGYSIGETESRFPIYEYPEYDYKVTEELSNFEL